MDTERYATSRRDAKRLGLYSYYTGKPCPQGHYSARYTHSCECMTCNRTGYAEKPRRPPVTITQRPQIAWAAGWAVKPFLLKEQLAHRVAVKDLTLSDLVFAIDALLPHRAHDPDSVAELIAERHQRRQSARESAYRKQNAALFKSIGE